jgi:diguanylate cyclase (GGDEF)-like protein/PAS domain S-box-containing protein
MLVPLASHYEQQRLQALQQLHLLDSDFEPTYDGIAKLAAEICGVAIAIISFADADRYWFKAVVGMEGVREMPKPHIFCSSVLESDGFFQVEDASQDSRFADNPLVSGALGIRFYAGVPLIDPKHFILGALCVMDSNPGKLDAKQQAQLDLLAELVMQITQNRAIRINLMQQALDREVDALKNYRETPVMMHSLDANGILQQVSNYWCTTLGYRRQDVIGKRVLKFFTKASRRDLFDIVFPEFLRLGYCIDAPFQMIKQDGDIIDVLLTASADYDHAGNMTRSWSVMVDVTERNRLAMALESEKERAQVTLHSIGDAVITTDRNCIVDYLNPMAEYLTGWTLADAQGRPLSDVFAIINEVTRNPSVASVLRCIEEGRVFGLAHHSVLVDRFGREKFIEDTAAPIRTSNGAITGAVLVFHDVSEQRHLQEKIAYQARYDQLTGLVNRYEFAKQLQQLLWDSVDTDKEHAFCYLDLDQFKLVNDTCGHAAGDELLRQLTTLLKSQVRKEDTLARLGGDEFGLLLRHCSLENAYHIAQSVYSAVEDFRFFNHDRRFKIGICIGLVPISAGNQNVDRILQAGDTACYAAKQAGRNQIYVLREEDEEVAHHFVEMQWYSRIPQALEENRFVLCAQPIKKIAADDEEKLYFEILVRLQDDNGELIPPSAFIPAAERYNLASSIDRWVFENTLLWLVANPFIVENLHLCSINLSGQSVGDPKFYQFVQTQLEVSQIPAHKICFEITETSAIADLGNAIAFMKKLGKKGCLFALDDFGNGLSSLGYLKNLPVDILKIDGLFVRDIVDDPIDLALVRSINEIAQLLGKKTVAEYVENHAIFEQLQQLGVDYAQGYGIDKPVLLSSLSQGNFAGQLDFFNSGLMQP